ncbi:MAG: hypothetical protein KDD55_11070, partial [Bdellovibrionales bacterium]|nr:hypothetical protein [Bdellovibrionales bacterium]
SEEAFRSSYHSRVKKVLTTDASNLDILQELVATYEDLCEQGKKLRGKSIVVTQAKGGVGASTIAAGLSQASASSGATTLLWDLDIESRDVTRALDCPAFSNVAFRRILEEKEKLSRQSFRECCYPLDTSFHILPPPNSMAACMDMIGNIECLPLVQRIFHLANATHENVIVDTAGRLSPT